MKKMLVFLAIALLAGAAMAQNWGLFDANRSDVTINGINNTFWNLTDVYSPTTPTDYGIVSSLILSDFSIFTWKNTRAGGDVFGGTFNYSIDGGAFVPVALNWIQNIGSNGDQEWGFTGQTINLAASLAPGVHTVDFYTEVRGTNNPAGSLYDNGGAGAPNYNATFRTQAIPEPATMSLLGLGALAMVLRRKIRK